MEGPLFSPCTPSLARACPLVAWVLLRDSVSGHWGALPWESPAGGEGAERKAKWGGFTGRARDDVGGWSQGGEEGRPKGRTGWNSSGPGERQGGCHRRRGEGKGTDQGGNDNLPLPALPPTQLYVKLAGGGGSSHMWQADCGGMTQEEHPWVAESQAWNCNRLVPSTGPRVNLHSNSPQERAGHRRPVAAQPEGWCRTEKGHGGRMGSPSLGTASPSPLMTP